MVHAKVVRCYYYYYYYRVDCRGHVQYGRTRGVRSATLTSMAAQRRIIQTVHSDVQNVVWRRQSNPIQSGRTRYSRVQVRRVRQQILIALTDRLQRVLSAHLDTCFRFITSFTYVYGIRLVHTFMYYNSIVYIILSTPEI